MKTALESFVGEYVVSDSDSSGHLVLFLIPRTDNVNICDLVVLTTEYKPGIFTGVVGCDATRACCACA